jgi:hypothetical protein
MNFVTPGEFLGNAKTFGPYFCAPVVTAVALLPPIVDVAYRHGPGRALRGNAFSSSRCEGAESGPRERRIS